VAYVILEEINKNIQKNIINNAKQNIMKIEKDGYHQEKDCLDFYHLEEQIQD
jgi:hypothetical protein